MQAFAKAAAAAAAAAADTDTGVDTNTNVGTEMQFSDELTGKERGAVHRLAAAAHLGHISSTDPGTRNRV